LFPNENFTGVSRVLGSAKLETELDADAGAFVECRTWVAVDSACEGIVSETVNPDTACKPLTGVEVPSR
jgi:hypothetical protein